MFAFRTRRPAAPPARKATLAVSALETRECPAVLLSRPSHEPVTAPPAHPPADAAHQASAPTAMARMARPLNPQPLPP